MPLAMHALLRLAPQVGEMMINANRNLAAYESMGVPVWPDALPDYPGPLAGFLAGLERCETPYLVTVPCDSPLFPDDLVARLAARARRRRRRDRDGRRRARTASCAAAGVLPDARDGAWRAWCDSPTSGRRKIDAWTAHTALVAVRGPTTTRARSSTPTPLDELRQLRAP